MNHRNPRFWRSLTLSLVLFWTVLFNYGPTAASEALVSSASTLRNTAPVASDPGPLDPDATTVRIAVIGDYGRDTQAEADVARLVKSWQPNVIITTGDNNYPDGAASTIDRNIGKYYYPYIYPYVGTYGTSASPNRFFPTLGNHDWNTTGAKPYLNYFKLPGNERYYSTRVGPVALFAIDSDSREPDGVSSTSTQALWLKNALSTSTAQWNLVYMHHAPYSSGAEHGSSPTLRWPYKAWGADAVLSGHEHSYERLSVNWFPYFVVGTSGSSLYGFSTPVAGSVKRYNGNYGALLITASTTTISYTFISRTGVQVDNHTRVAPVTQQYVPLVSR